MRDRRVAFRADRAARRLKRPLAGGRRAVARRMKAVRQLPSSLIAALPMLDERLANRAAPPVLGAIDPATIAWSADIESHWEEIREELDALLAADITFPETDALVGYPQGAGGAWTTYVLSWYGTWVDSNCRRCPRTTEALRAVPDLQIAGFTVLGPHAHLPRHQGPAKSLRYQLGVKIPRAPGTCRLQIGDDVVVWEDRKSLAFDDRSFHEAWNESDEARYVLFVQTRWPLKGLPLVVHRATHWLFSKAASTVPRRAVELDLALNAGAVDAGALPRTDLNETTSPSQ